MLRSPSRPSAEIVSSLALLAKTTTILPLRGTECRGNLGGVLGDLPCRQVTLTSKRQSTFEIFYTPLANVLTIMVQ